MAAGRSCSGGWAWNRWSTSGCDQRRTGTPDVHRAPAGEPRRPPRTWEWCWLGSALQEAGRLILDRPTPGWRCRVPGGTLEGGLEAQRYTCERSAVPHGMRRSPGCNLISLSMRATGRELLRVLGERSAAGALRKRVARAAWAWFPAGSSNGRLGARQRIINSSWGPGSPGQ